MVQLLFKFLVNILVLYTGVVSANKHYVIAQCVTNCNITGEVINGGEGDNITLKYVINSTTFVTLNLDYDSTKVLQISKAQRRIFQKDTCPSFIDLNTTLVSTTKGYSFSFKIINLNNAIHNGKRLIYDLSLGTSNKVNSSTINVQYGPKLLEKWKPSYEVRENGTLDVNITFSGNPKPQIVARMENGTIELTVLRGPISYVYNIKLRRIDRSLCGRNVIIKVIGYKRITYVAKLNVSFIPSTPRISYASLTRENSENCLHVGWNKIESGACRVTYQILFTYNHRRNNITLSSYSLEYRHCFGIITNVQDIRVQAEVGGINSSFSRPTQVVLAEKVEGARNDNNLILTYIAIVIVICFLALLDIGILLFIRGKHKFKYIFLPLTVVGIPLLIIYLIIRKSTYQSVIKVRKQHSINAFITTPVVIQDDAMSGSFSQPIDADVVVEMKPVAGDYARIGNLEQGSNGQSLQEKDYAVLGPGGRREERTLVQSSPYAEVNTDATYYPPLDQGKGKPPVYAVSTKARTSKVDDGS